MQTNHTLISCYLFWSKQNIFMLLPKIVQRKVNHYYIIIHF